MKHSQMAALAALVALSSAPTAFAQSWEVGRIRTTFVSEAPLETINGSSETGSGSVTLDPSNVAATRGTITVPVSSLRTGIELRDEHLRGSDWLNGGQHPNLRLEITGASGASSLTANQEARVTLRGRLTVNGRTNDVTVNARVRWDGGDTIQAICTFRLRLPDYGISVNAAVRQKVSDDIRLNVRVRLNR